MTRSIRTRMLIAIMAVLAVIAAALPQRADAHSGVVVRRPIIVRGFYGWPYYGFGWGGYYSPFYGPYPGYGYGPEGGIDLNVAVLAGLGAVKLDVKPGQTEVWVDGTFYAEARDLDGYPSYLWLPDGVHHLVMYRAGYLRFEEDVDVHRGIVKDLKVRLQRGESVPPGEKPGESRSN
jgi:hypothetical protein